MVIFKNTGPVDYGGRQLAELLASGVVSPDDRVFDGDVRRLPMWANGLPTVAETLGLEAGDGEAWCKICGEFVAPQIEVVPQKWGDARVMVCPNCGGGLNAEIATLGHRARHLEHHESGRDKAFQEAIERGA